MTVECAGFKKVEAHVTLPPDSIQPVDVNLQMGQVSEEVAVMDAAAARPPGPWWNTWITKQGALETGREAFLVHGRPYKFYVELSAIESRQAARGETSKELTAELRHKLVQLVRDNETRKTFFVRIGIVGRAVQLSRAVNPVQAWSPPNQWAPTGDSASSGAFEADLSNLFPEEVPATPGRNPLTSSARAGAIQFGLVAGKKPGCAVIAVSIWDDTRMVPLDHLVRTVAVGQKMNCAVPVVESPTAPALYSNAARGVDPDASLHVFEFNIQGKLHSASFLAVRNPKPEGRCQSYQWDSDATLSAQVLSGDEFTRDLTEARNSGGSYAPAAKVLIGTVFAEADRTNTCGAAAALAALKEAAKATDVRMFARVSDDQSALNVVPLGLMAMHQEGGQNAFAHDIRLIQPVSQESLEDTACVSDWTFVLPQALDGFTADQLALPPSLVGDPRVLRTLDDFLKRFVNAPGDSGTSGLLLLAHHLNGVLTTVPGDKLTFGEINRDLGPGSIAILSACKTANLTDNTGLVRGLNEHGVDGMVATAFELDEHFGKPFAFHFAEQVAKASDQGLTLEQVFEAALRKTTKDLTDGSSYTAEQARGMSLELVLAGNPSLKICVPARPQP